MARAATRSTTAAPKRSAYHHGNLRDALIDVAVDLIGEHGVDGFSMAEACRRLHVTVAAPYRHFADRNALLTAVAARGIERLGEMLQEAVAESAAPEERMASAARGYVRFAALHPALFDVMYAQEVFMGGNPDLIDVVRPVAEPFVRPAYALRGVTNEQAVNLVLGTVAAAHGYAAFLRAGTFKNAMDPVETAAESAARMTRALIEGRGALVGSAIEASVALAGASFDSWVHAVAEPASGRANA